MKKFEIANHEPSFLPEEHDWKLVWSDEFDGTKLDKTKWDFRKHVFHARNNCWLEEEGIEIKDSNIIFKLIEKNGKFYSCQLQTGENWYDRPTDNNEWCIAPFSTPKFLHKYGYYEVRCKLQKSAVWWSAFWLQSPNIGTHRDERISGVEVDIMESFMGNSSYIPHCLHWGGYGDDHKYAATHGFTQQNPVNIKRDSMYLDEGFHRFGCLWDKEGYTFYVDGKVSGDGKLTDAVSDNPQFILIGTECKGYRSEDVSEFTYNAAIKDAKARNDFHNDKFIVDYIRVFDIVE